MIVMPLFVTVFFTSLMDSGQPTDMPIGIVDLDNTSTTRKLSRMIDSFQNSHVVAHYASIDDARRAIQRNEIYGFMLFPRSMTSDLIGGRRPRMSIYYTNTTLAAGALLYKEMKTVCTLASAAVGQATMQAVGMTEGEIRTFLQPISIDAHTVGNPWINYNIYISTMLVPGVLLLFVFLMTAYSLGTEIKFDTRHEWLTLAGGNIYRAIAGKIIPQTAIFLCVIYACMAYMYGILHFPAPGGILRIMLIGFLTVTASQGFAIFLFGLIPSLRMSMSVCSLWGVLSFSMVGTAFPVFAMDAPLQTLSWLFPLRHYFLFYQLCIFNDYPLADVMPHILALLAFCLLPLFVISRIDYAVKKYEYIQ